MARSTRCNAMSSNLSVTCDRSVVLSRYYGFLYQYNWLSRYNWKIVESDVWHHKLKPLIKQKLSQSESTHSVREIRVAQSLVCFLVFCRSLFSPFLLAIAMFGLLRCTTSDYPLWYLQCLLPMGTQCIFLVLLVYEQYITWMYWIIFFRLWPTSCYK